MAEPRWIWQCDRLIPSEPGAGHPVTVEVLEQLRRHHWGKHDRFGVQLAMEEALVNAITHGNDRDQSKQVHVVCRLAPDLLRIEITDEGAGFDPSTLPDPTNNAHLSRPHGRGVMLIRYYMSRVEYNDIGNCVILEKDRADSLGG